MNLMRYFEEYLKAKKTDQNVQVFCVILIKSVNILSWHVSLK
jgi:hypothetical protein